MKIIKNVTPLERRKMYIKVNAPDQGKGITMDVFKARESLFEKIKEGAETEDPEMLDFKRIPEGDLKLKESEWRELKNCFSKGVDMNMAEASQTQKVLTRVEEAQEYKDK